MGEIFLIIKAITSYFVGRSSQLNLISGPMHHNAFNQRYQNKFNSRFFAAKKSEGDVSTGVRTFRPMPFQPLLFQPFTLPTA